MTHTYAILTVSRRTFDEVRSKLADAGYDFALHDGGATLDMHGITLQVEEQPSDDEIEALTTGDA